jgi:hypothetical protein
MLTYCSPEKLNSSKKTKTCYSKKHLIIIAEQYNATHPKNKITHIKNKTISQLLENLEMRLKIHQSKWMDMFFVANINQDIKEEMEESFRPEPPTSWLQNNSEWLSNIDIQEVIEQYEDEYKSFHFLGVHPVDFSFIPENSSQCISTVLCNFELEEYLKKKYNKVCIIFNLDKHDGPGSHWVTLMCGLSPKLKNFGCYFIDSNSTPPPIEIVLFMEKIDKQIHNHYKIETAKKFELIRNRRRFQYENSECGMFSIYFTVQFITTSCTFTEIISQNIDDDKVRKLRKQFFNFNRII